MRIIRTPNHARKPKDYDVDEKGPWPRFTAYSGERYGEVFIKGRAVVEDDAKAAELVRGLGYVDVTEDEAELSAAERRLLAARANPRGAVPELPQIEPSQRGKLP